MMAWEWVRAGAARWDPVGAPYLPPPGEDGSSSDAQNGRLRRGRSAEVFEQTQPYFWGNGEGVSQQK